MFKGKLSALQVIIYQIRLVIILCLDTHPIQYSQDYLKILTGKEPPTFETLRPDLGLLTVRFRQE